ncbi:MAG: GNAT family N-acetyltransferase [Pseudomonadota bacterium]
MIFIRPAQSTETVELASLIAETNNAEAWDEDALARLVEGRSSGVMVARRAESGPGAPTGGRALAGFSLWSSVKDESELLLIGVSPERRRHGLGGRLLRGAMVQAVAVGARAMFLEVSTANDAAKALYFANGFQAVGVRPNYYGEGADASILRAALC